MPWIIGFGIFLAYPIFASIYFSFTEYSVLKPAMWTGVENYETLISDKIFRKSLVNTLIFAVAFVPVSTFVALGLALLLNTKVKFMSLYRTVFFVPSLVPVVSMVILWIWLFNGEYGLINTILGWVGVEGPNWLGDPKWSKSAIIFMSTWGVGNAMIIYLAGLQEVPQSLYEAADIDGASPWRKTLHVTIPLISPVIMFNVIMGIIGSLQIFTQPFIMSETGSPARSIYFYSMYLFDNAFKYHKMGYASAMAWIMFIIIFGLTLLAIKASNKYVHYEGG
ncbi:MAG: sugar ABC transporter permease [Armatimonadetes bacterium]|nr:sugar ABC transporter permease [Armatimonadota bacterium]